MSKQQEPKLSDENDADHPASVFLKHIAALDAGDKAILKRVAGCTIADARGAMSVFYRILPHEVPQWDRDVYFLVATLYCLESTSPLRHKGNFGTTMRRVRRNFDSKSLDRRMNALIDSRLEEGELGYRLRQAVKLAYSKNVAVDWRRLVIDLTHWSHTNHYIQQQWVEAYYGKEYGKKNTSNDNNEEKQQGDA